MTASLPTDCYTGKSSKRAGFGDLMRQALAMANDTRLKEL
jgi:hypothetical protein